jgi:hypothetical protein
MTAVIEDLAMPLIDGYEAQLVYDAEGLWTAWPELPAR